MNTTNNTTTKTSHGLKGFVTKGYVKTVNVAAHTVTLIDGLADKTPAMWAKASGKAASDMDALFAELGI